MGVNQFPGETKQSAALIRHVRRSFTVRSLSRSDEESFDGPRVWSFDHFLYGRQCGSIACFLYGKQRGSSKRSFPADNQRLQ